MDKGKEDNTDARPLRPVSSLRSHFETLLSAQTPSSTAPPSRNVSPQVPSAPKFEKNLEPLERPDSRFSLDIPRGSRNPSPNRPCYATPGPFTPESREARRSRPGTPRQRPNSMLSLSPPRSPPKVTIDSPGSPPKFSELVSAFSAANAFKSLKSGSSRSGSPQPSTPRHVRGLSRTNTPGLDVNQSPKLEPSPASSIGTDPQKNSPLAKSPAPPVNRAAKPKVPSKPPSVSGQPITGERKVSAATLAPDAGHETGLSGDEKVSPFSTPPSSEGSSPGYSPAPASNQSNKPARPTINTAMNFEGYFGVTPVKLEKRRISPTRPKSPMRPKSPIKRRSPTRSSKPGSREQSRTPRTPTAHPDIRNAPQDRPDLPPRRPQQTSETRADTLPLRERKAPEPPPARRSMDTLSRTAITQSPQTIFPPPRRTEAYPTAPLSAGPHRRSPSNANKNTRISSELRREPPPRISSDLRRDLPAPVGRVSVAQLPATYDSDEEAHLPVNQKAPVLSDFPDTSQANRRPPLFPHRPYDIHTKYETKLFAVSGEYLCTTGFVTKVWNILTNELILTLSHGELVKVTAICFKPTQDPNDEGKRLWLGTNHGEIHELDIGLKEVVLVKGNAHLRKEIIKIYRHGSEMWTLDDDGRTHVWPADETGTPSLSQTPLSHQRNIKVHSASIVTDNCLWIASGKEIRVYKRSYDHNVFVPVLKDPLSQHGVGDVTAASTIPKQPDRLYFGHNDGKVTMYSRKDYSCLGVVSVSLYKISSLVGVGEYLWAGYITGMIYVYDTASTPWKVKKDWHAHDQPIAGVVVDATSIWKLDRLQVASLGIEGVVKLWDGMLSDDWLELDMQEHDAEYCDFRELEALFLTWNAGASKPTALRHDEQDANFFRDLLTPLKQKPPDLLVFGFQELVDLENKKVTAKSFFKKKKKDETTELEKMSHQYRAWKDHLAQCLQEYLPNEQYVLLHNASLVGLFTCVFVKASERPNIRDIKGAEVKLGMGGYHGNKGALILRFILDDSSLCFFNCHLAAGQTQTVHRNNDIATILETSSLPPHLDSATRQDTFVGGGDGSMILDHEICILNGDLNYRIDSMTRDSVVKDVERGNLSKLLERDQLLLSRRKNPGFRLRAFMEAPITFAPTYKYDVGTDRYDTSDKKRSPAWCDRLLYRGKGRIKQVEYRRWEVRVSDHRPVSGRFKIRVKTVDQRRRVGVKEGCEHRFGEVKGMVFRNVKLDYLVNVLGMSTKDAQRLLDK